MFTSLRRVRCCALRATCPALRFLFLRSKSFQPREAETLSIYFDTWSTPGFPVSRGTAGRRRRRVSPGSARRLFPPAGFKKKEYMLGEARRLCLSITSALPELSLPRYTQVR